MSSHPFIAAPLLARRRALLALPLLALLQCAGPHAAPARLTFGQYHFDAARTGWSDSEDELVPARVRQGLAPAWATPVLDDAEVSFHDKAGVAHVVRFPPRLFATPLYLDDVTVTAPAFVGVTTSVVFAATTNDWVYAIAAADTPAPGGIIRAGTILWRTSVGQPRYVPTFDHGTPLGVLSTPILDTSATPPTLYLGAADVTHGWQVFAIDATSGRVLPGWPLALAPAAVAAVNRNAPTDGRPAPVMASAATASQRAALALDRGVLFLGFGSYYDGNIGWMIAVDTRTPRVLASFSGAPEVPTPPPDDPGNKASAGMWGAGGPAIASDHRIFMSTGNSPADSAAAPGVFGNSVLAFTPELALNALYSPFNYCVMDAGDTDLGGSTPVVFDVDPARTSTPHLTTFGGKQGVMYLADRDHLGGSIAARRACDLDAANDDPASDTSLFGPQLLSQYAPARPGPLSVFGPYSEGMKDNMLDRAKMRSTPAVFRPKSGDIFVYATGTTRTGAALDHVVPPCLARLRVHLEPGRPAYLEPDFATNTTAVFHNPGAPIVTSHDGGADPVVWVLDQNARRTDPVVPKGGFTPPNAILYAFDGTTLETLWQSAPGDLGPSGKYGHVVVAHGTVFVATDRVTAFRSR